MRCTCKGAVGRQTDFPGGLPGVPLHSSYSAITAVVGGGSWGLKWCCRDVFWAPIPLPSPGIVLFAFTIGRGCR